MTKEERTDQAVAYALFEVARAADAVVWAGFPVLADCEKKRLSAEIARTVSDYFGDQFQHYSSRLDGLDELHATAMLHQLINERHEGERWVQVAA